MNICLYLIIQTKFFRILHHIVFPSNYSLNHIQQEIWNTQDQQNLAIIRVFYLVDSLKRQFSRIWAQTP